MSWEERPYAGFGGTGGGRRFADNPLNWSPMIGRVAGITIRVHITLILVFAFELLSAMGREQSIAFVLQLGLVVFVSILLHEFGHCFAARAVGGRADEILMWPLGGLAFCDVPRLVWPEFVTVVCGPLVTLFLLVGAAALRSFEFTFDLFTGWQSPYQMWAEPRAWIDLVYLVNYALFMFNLIPMYPMDMGRIAQCAMWPWLGYRKSMAAATTLGMIAAVVLGLWALVNSAYMVLAIALFGYLTCYQERQLVQAGIRTEDGYMGYDFSGGYTTLEGKRERSAGFIARWRRKRADAARRRQQVSAETEQQEVDRILEKVHREGLQSLTRSEKRTLQMATKRQQDSSRHRV